MAGIAPEKRGYGLTMEWQSGNRRTVAVSHVMSMLCHHKHSVKDMLSSVPTYLTSCVAVSVWSTIWVWFVKLNLQWCAFSSSNHFVYK